MFLKNTKSSVKRKPQLSQKFRLLFPIEVFFVPQIIIGVEYSFNRIVFFFILFLREDTRLTNNSEKGKGL